MPDILDYFGFDPVLGYRYRPSSGDVQRPPPDLYTIQGGQPVPYRAPTGDPYDALRDYTGVADLQRGFQAAGEGNYPAAAGNIALGTGTMAAALPAGAFGLMARGVRKGADALSVLDAAITRTRSAKELAANAAEPLFPQYATQYPPNLAPAVKLKEKQKTEGGTETFLSRRLSPDAEALMAERARIQKDMDKYGYEPYYKPQEREYVDPSNYPPANVDTSTLAPSKWDTISDYMTAVGAPETLKALQGAVAKGATLGDTAHWYAMAQHEASFTKELGPEAGRAAFLDRYAVPLAATTSGNAPRENFMLGHYLEYLRQTGQPYPGHSSEMPAPIYGQYLGNNLDDYLRMRGIDPKTRQPIPNAPTGYDYLGANQPKMHNFARSQIGDLTQPVMDKQMSEGMLAHAPGYADKVRTRGYGLIQAPLVAEAERVAPAVEQTNWLLPNMRPRSFQPGNLQDVGWAGFGDKTGKPMIMEINDAIERTHRLTGMPRDEIVRLGLVRQQIPIYGAAGLALGGLGGLGGYE